MTKPRDLATLGGGFTQSGTLFTRTVENKLKDTVSVKDFGAVGDYNPSTNSGTNDSTAFNQATQVASTVYVPEGAYLISTFPNLTTFLSKGWFGPGEVYYDNGSSTEQIGKIVRSGVNDPDGNLGTLTQGGLLIGGEGPGSNGVLVYGQHPGWVQFQSTCPGNPTEIQVYSSAIIGIASSVIGTAFIDATYVDFSSSRIQVNDIIVFGRTEYRVKTQVSNTRIELKTTAGGTVTFASSYSETFRHCYIYADGFCDTSGTGVTWKSGDYFFDVSVSYSEKKIIIANTDYAVSSVSNSRSLTLSSSAGTQSGAAFTLRMYANGAYVSLLRLQSLVGTSEEAAALYIGNTGDVFLETQFAGSGRYRPLRFRTGPDYDYGYHRDHFSISADGRIGCGKDYVETGFPTNAKAHIWREGTTAQATNGATDLRFITLDSKHTGTAPRQLAFGFHNNFNCGYIQGFQDAAGTTAGTMHIQPFGGNLRVGGGTTTFTPNVLSVGGNISATADNTHSCGTSAYRWTEIFAATGTINTSDEREKEQGRSLSEAEQAVAVRIKGLLKVFKFSDAVARKGGKARIHFGVYAQEVAAAFEAEGLNASDYALFCYDEWEEEHDEQGTKVQDAGNRYGIRYEELLAFVLAAL